MQNDPEGVRQELDSAIPEEAVSTREAWRGGPKLSYLSGAYVINRLNQVLGQGNWSYQLDQLTKVFEGAIAQSAGDAFSTSYLAQVTLKIVIAGQAVFFTEVGYGDGTDKKSQGKAHELAVKEATTDALKRAAKNLGMSMGLELYFKDGAYTGMEEKTPAAIAAEIKTPVESAVKAPSTKILRQKIKSAFSVLQENKKVSKEDFIKKYLSGGKTDDLTDEQVPMVIEMLKADFPAIL